MAEQRAGFFQFDRDAKTSPIRLAALIAVGLVVLLLLLWMFQDGDAEGSEPPPVYSASAAQAPSSHAAESQQSMPTAGSVAELRLHGVMGTGDDGAAIVSVGASTQRLVRVGRDVLPGVPLLAVAADHIVLRENGREVRLAFSEDRGGAAVSVVGSASESSPASRDDEASRREAREYQAALAPHRIDGRHVGYRFRAERMPEMFRDAGVRPDDVILRIGGLGLEDADAVAGIPRRIRQRGRVEIEILRDAQPQTIILDAH